MSRSISIYVVTHKEFNPPTGEIYVPIQVGKMFTKNELPYIGDDTGDNITQKNKNYCELTAMYWIWKNDDSKIVGLCHYRRYFTVSAVFASNTLILAKENPERYRNLIVRVWGFSAYFVDLPEDYQDVLIKRVQLSEASF